MNLNIRKVLAIHKKWQGLGISIALNKYKIISIFKKSPKVEGMLRTAHLFLAGVKIKNKIALLEEVTLNNI